MHTLQRWNVHTNPLNLKASTTVNTVRTLKQLFSLLKAHSLGKFTIQSLSILGDTQVIFAFPQQPFQKKKSWDLGMCWLFKKHAFLSHQTRWRCHAVKQNIPFEEIYNEQKRESTVILGMMPLDSSKSDAAINQSLQSAERKMNLGAWSKKALKRYLQIKKYHDFFFISPVLVPQLLWSIFTFYTSFFHSICELNKMSYGGRCVFFSPFFIISYNV